MQIRPGLVMVFPMMDVVNQMAKLAKERGVQMPKAPIDGGHVVMRKDGESVTVIASFAPTGPPPVQKPFPSDIDS